MKVSKLSLISIITFIALSLVFTISGTAQDSSAVQTQAVEATAAEAGAEHVATEPAHEEHAAGEEKLNAGKLIMEHIADSHGWHLWGHTSIPLPVIVYNAQRGLTVFSSARFEHGHKAYEGYKLNEAGKIEAVNEMGEVDAHTATVNEEISAATYDISITKNVCSIFITIAILLLVFTSVAKMYTNKRKGLAPTGLQNAVEPIIIFMRDDVIKASIGEKKYEKYVPYLLTLFFFIWINNLLGLIPIFPGGANVTGNISVALVLAVLTFIITVVSGNKYYWQHIFAMPGVPKGVLVLLTPIEILGMFLRPFVLMIRLFANIAAGHIIALSFFCLIFIFGQESLYGTGGGLGVSPLSLVFTVFMAMLELLVAFLQAYVFTLLSSVYIGAAVEEHHHDDHH
ncbi:MAG TPA: F0F1 ATP synthase subunit A [Bacteroidia bacterium]|jgi:F-type H+-transporting ATPase subunit a|nr:F0F1 ATP synthase subunit A [Bacteroidia bacterium]HQK97298.1 F0F1 ATP synthase subunit A [Bacteroidia bacterium]